MKRLWLIALFSIAAQGQVSNPSVVYQASAPSGPCSPSAPIYVVISTGAIWTCNNGTYAASGSTGTVNSGTANQFAYYASTGPTVSGTGTMTVSSVVGDPVITFNSGAVTDPTWSGAGIPVGINAAAVYTGNLIEGHLSANSIVFSVNYLGLGSFANLNDSGIAPASGNAPVTVNSSGAIQSSANAAISSATGGTNTGTVTCLTATCTNLSGTYSVAGGTFTTGNLLVLVWPTTTTAYKCWATQNGSIGTTYGIGHTVATATGMTITNGVTVAGVTVTFDYGCSKA